MAEGFPKHLDITTVGPCQTRCFISLPFLQTIFGQYQLCIIMEALLYWIKDRHHHGEDLVAEDFTNATLQDALDKLELHNTKGDREDDGLSFLSKMKTGFSGCSGRLSLQIISPGVTSVPLNY